MTENKKRILFVNDEMRMGGVARVLNTLMASLPQEKYEIDLLVLHKHGMLLKEVPPQVHVLEGTPFFKTVDESLESLFKQGNWGGLWNKLRLLFYMKTGLITKRIRKERQAMLPTPYDVEVAAKEGFCTVFTACGDSKKKINWVLTDYSVCNYSKRHMRLVKKALQRIDLNVADSTQALEAYQKVFDVSGGKVIHNLMNLGKIENGIQEATTDISKGSGINIITVARFHPQKGIERLLQASKDASEKGYAHQLYLIGGGEEEEELKKQVQDNGQNNVTFLGYKQNPYGDIAACDLFVLSSYYEGFATVINESLLAGTPVLTTKVSGTEEQITSPDYGWIVENTQEGLSQGLIQALQDPTILKQKKEILKKYTYPNDQILQQFIDVF